MNSAAAKRRWITRIWPSLSFFVNVILTFYCSLIGAIWTTHYFKAFFPRFFLRAWTKVENSEASSVKTGRAINAELHGFTAAMSRKPTVLWRCAALRSPDIKARVQWTLIPHCSHRVSTLLLPTAEVVCPWAACLSGRKLGATWLRLVFVKTRWCRLYSRVTVKIIKLQVKLYDVEEFWVKTRRWLSQQRSI